MSDIPRIVMWCGKPIDECTREDLLECIDWLANQVNELNTPEAREARIKAKVERVLKPPSRYTPCSMWGDWAR